MSKSMPSFIKRWENKRRKVKRGKRKEKQVITVAPMKSSMSVLLLLEWLRMWGGGEGGVVCVWGGAVCCDFDDALYAICGGPFQLGQELLPGRVSSIMSCV